MSLPRVGQVIHNDLFMCSSNARAQVVLTVSLMARLDRKDFLYGRDDFCGCVGEVG